MNKDQIYSLCEAVADIAYIAGQQNFYSGDSRSDISTFIEWAKEFERINNSIQWGVDEGMDYIDAIYSFTIKKINSVSLNENINGS